MIFPIPRVLEFCGYSSLRYTNLILFYDWAETEQGAAQAIIRSVVDFKRDLWSKVSDNAMGLGQRMPDPDPKKSLQENAVLPMEIAKGN